MSKKVEEVNKEIKKVWYKTATLPWAIIITVIIFFGGVVYGWYLRSNDISRVSTEASSMVSQLKSAE